MRLIVLKLSICLLIYFKRFSKIGLFQPYIYQVGYKNSKI